jgi:hypothetical protein
MPTSLRHSLSRLTEKMVDLLWHQWSTIGVAGYARTDQNQIIDPEALILATTRFGRHDARLMDESIDWLMKLGQRISLQRLQGLHKQWPNVADPRVLGVLADLLGSQALHRKWRVLGNPPASDVEPELFFIGPDGRRIPYFKSADPTFEKQGLLRGKLDLRGMSRAPDPRNRENLILTLRALLGVNARAEITAWLLTHDSGHPAAIARSTGYFSKSIQQILNEMAGSGQISSVRLSREKHFSLPHRDAWLALLFPANDKSIPFCHWVDWMPLFSAVTRFTETLSKPGLDENSEAFQAVHLRETLEAATPALAQAGRLHSMRAAPALRGSELITAVLADLESMIPD